MAELLAETVSPEDLRKFEVVYHEQLHHNDVTTKAQFEYAWCLVRSKYSSDIRKGTILLEELYRTHEEGQRDYLYYLTVGAARLKEYTKALGYVRSFLDIEPGNAQIIALEQAIKKKMEKEGLTGIAIAGGMVLAAGAALGVLMVFNKGK